jgi:hypothetical protein
VGLRSLARGMDFCCECYVLLGRGLCDGPITCPEESYRVWCVLRQGLNETTLHATRQRVQSPAGALAGRKLVVHITRRNEKAGQSTSTRWYPKYSVLVLPSIQQLW